MNPCTSSPSALNPGSTLCCHPGGGQDRLLDDSDSGLISNTRQLKPVIGDNPFLRGRTPSGVPLICSIEFFIFWALPVPRAPALQGLWRLSLPSLIGTGMLS